MAQGVYSCGRWVVAVIATGLSVFALGASAAAQMQPLPTPGPQPGAYGLEATKTQAPPTQGATITVPGPGSSFTTSPIEVRGICPDGLLVQVYNNNVMVGAVMCEGGSFSVQVSLFIGTNDLKAIVYDDLGQAGPVSNEVQVQYSNTNLAAFGELITLTSTYGRRSSAAGNLLDWPLQLSGGTGPYACSIDWGDATEPELLSQSLAGALTIGHTYKRAGIYQVNIRVTDTNGVSAFLQVIALSSGEVDQSAQGSNDEDATANGRTEVLWIPAALSLGLLLPTFWLGRRSQLVSLRTKMLKERDKYQDS